MWNFVTPTWGKKNVGSYAEWRDLTDGIIISFTASMVDGVAVCHLTSLIHIAHVMFTVHHNLQLYGFPSHITGSYCMLGHCEHSSVFVCPACPSTILPSSHPSCLCECLSVSVSFSWVLGCVACPISLVPQSHNSKFVRLQSHRISKGGK